MKKTLNHVKLLGILFLLSAGIVIAIKKVYAIQLRSKVETLISANSSMRHYQGMTYDLTGLGPYITFNLEKGGDYELHHIKIISAKNVYERSIDVGHIHHLNRLTIEIMDNGIHALISVKLTSKSTLWLLFYTLTAIILAISAILLFKLLLERKNSQELNILTKQVAHDIRSPLSSLNFAISDLEQFPFEKRILIENAYRRINDIANNLLHKGASSRTTSKSETSVCHVFKIIEGIISEKRLEFGTKPHISITHSFSEDSLSLFSQVNESALSSIISNIINNAVESIEETTGEVSLRLEKLDNNYIQIFIKDTGKGIPPVILAQLGHKQVSWGKNHGTSGSGLGLLSAKREIDHWKGKLIISSEPGKGTTVAIHLPIEMKPDWFCDTVTVSPSTIILVLDDDPSIHHILKEKFRSNPFHAFSDPYNCEKWIQANPSSNFFIFCDFEFKGFGMNGIAFISKHKLEMKSLLVSSYLEDTEIAETCSRKEIKGFPKRLVHYLKTDSSKPSPAAILIDDDKFIRLAWEMEAKKRNIPFLALGSIDHLLRIAIDVNKSTPIFIDSDLGNGIKGEIDSKRLAVAGFSNLYIATNYDLKSVNQPQWINAIVAKNFPSNL